MRAGRAERRHRRGDGAIGCKAVGVSHLDWAAIFRRQRDVYVGVRARRCLGDDAGRSRRRRGEREIIDARCDRRKIGDRNGPVLARAATGKDGI